MDRDIGRPLAHISHKLENIDLVADASTVLETERPLEREVSGINGGRYIARLMAYRGAGGDLRGVVITFLDVSAVRAEAEMFRAAYRGLAEARVPVILLNRNGEVHWVNAVFAELSGYEQRQLQGCNPRILLDRTAPEGTFDAIRELLGSQTSWSGTLNAQRRDGVPFPIRAIAVPMRDLRRGESGTLLIGIGPTPCAT
jgi:two-component system CheB/CheR fusion protein